MCMDMHGPQKNMQDKLRWNTEQKRRAHARIFEDLMRRYQLTEAMIVSRLEEDGPKSQSTISRWKTLDVRPNRHVYLDLLRNVFQLSYEQIDAMLWLCGMPPLLRAEVKMLLGGPGSFQERTENDLMIEAYRLLVNTIGNDLGLPAPYRELDMTTTIIDNEFTFDVKTPDKKIIEKSNELPLVLEGEYRTPNTQPLVWVVLQDKHKNYYLQSPPVNFLPNGRWIADNVVPGEGIISIHFVAVGAQGHNEFMSMVGRRQWGAFSDLPADGRVIKSLQIATD
jgi:hypothetical protein